MMAADWPPRQGIPAQQHPQHGNPRQNDIRSSVHGTLPGFPLPAPRRPGLLELAWNWRWEAGTLAALAYLMTQIAVSLSIAWLIAAAGAGLVVLSTMMCWPPARLRIIARWWCVVTPHRLRKGFVNAWVQTRDGNLPVILSCSPTAYGEQVRLWLPAGLTAGSLLSAGEVLAAACWAADVRVVRDGRRAHRVTLEVIRNSGAVGPHPGNEGGLRKVECE
jgi:hypothetical protein